MATRALQWFKYLLVSPMKANISTYFMNDIHSVQNHLSSFLGDPRGVSCRFD